MSNAPNQRKRASNTQVEGSKKPKGRSSLNRDTTETNDGTTENANTSLRSSRRVDNVQIEEDTYSYTDKDFAPIAPKEGLDDDKIELPTPEKENSMPYSLQELGYVYFFYRSNYARNQIPPKNVETFYMLLCPSDKERNHKLWRIPKNSLPAPETTSRYYCLVDKVSPDMSDLLKRLQTDKSPSDAKTQQPSNPNQQSPSDPNQQPPSLSTPPNRTSNPSQFDHPIAHGSYVIASKFKRSTIFYYMIDFPEAIGPSQEAFQIRNKGCYLLQCQNPENTLPNYPARLLEMFQNCRYSSVQEISMLEQPGSLLILASNNQCTADPGGEPTPPYIELKNIQASPNTNEPVCPIDKILKALHCSPRRLPSGTPVPSNTGQT